MRLASITLRATEASPVLLHPFKSTTAAKVDEVEVEKPLWTKEEFAELAKYVREDRCWVTMPIGITAKEMKKIKLDYDLVQDSKKKGIKHSVLCVSSGNYVRGPMMHGVLSKMLTDIVTDVCNRKERGVGAAVNHDSNLEPTAGTRFILHREKCPVYAHKKKEDSPYGNQMTKALFEAYEYVIDVQKRNPDWQVRICKINDEEWLNKRKLLGSFIPKKDRGDATDLWGDQIIDDYDISFEVLYDKIYEGCRNFLLTIYPEEAKKIKRRKIKSDDFLPDEHEEFFEGKIDEWWKY